MKKLLCIILTLTAVFSFAACKGKADPSLTLGWEYITGLPEGFPKLCDAVTESGESFDGECTLVTVSWNVLEEASYNEYCAKLEEWAGAKFGEAKDGAKSLSCKKGDSEITVKASYNGDADGYKKEDGSYNHQASLEVRTKNTGTAVAPAEKYTPIKWEQLVALPDGFPKLCDSVTTVDEIYGKEENCFALYWNRLSEGDFNSYISKIEEWAGAKFGEKAADGTRSLSTKKGDAEITVEAAYNGSATGNRLEGNKYDSQARIAIITPAN